MLQTKYIVNIIVSAIIFGASGVLIRFLDTEMSIYSQIFYRSLVSFLGISTILYYKKISIKLQVKDVPAILLSGVLGYSLMILFFTYSVIHTTLGSAYFLVFSEPIFACILGYLFLKEKINKLTIISIIIVFFGMIILFYDSIDIFQFKGNLFGVLAGLMYAVYIVSNRFLQENYPPLLSLWYSIGISLLIFFPFTFSEYAFTNYTWNSWIIIIIFGINNILAYYFLNLGLVGAKVNIASLLLVVEPLTALFFGYLFFNESLSLNLLIGSGVVVLGIAILTLKHRIHYLFRKISIPLFGLIGKEGVQ